MNPSRCIPSLSIIIPTLNAERVLTDCLESIFSQTYPHDCLEILIADGGSTDRTVEIASAYAARGTLLIQVLHNRLQTAEAGKAVGAQKARGEIVAFIDSDNILPDPDWLEKMVGPFRDHEVIASEPIEYTYRKTDGYITRYCALLGMNDPLCLFLGNYDRYSHLTGRWTDMPVDEEKREDYLLVRIESPHLPTIGANGFLIRRDVLLESDFGDYLFDIDVLADLLAQRQSLRIAKVRTGIIHLYTPDLKTFTRKQKRRVMDYLQHAEEGTRSYPWTVQQRWGLMRFVFSCVFVLPLFYQALRGISRKFDLCWFFHPLACWSTLWIYGSNVILRKAGFHPTISRAEWSQ